MCNLVSHTEGETYSEGLKIGPKKDEVTWEWRMIHNGELYDLYSTKYYSGVQIKKNEIGRARGTYEGHEGCIGVLVEKPEENENT